MKILVINGPNLNFLGIRDKKVYGSEDYSHLVSMIEEKAAELGCETECYQSNHEGDLIDRIQKAYSDGTDGIVINPGALTHYSYALFDALGSYDTIPMVEVHISDIHNREDFRKISVTAPACDLQIAGHGLNGYLEAMEYIADKATDH
ncbi:MAG: type II 3-dehydroquinate dehydratase [Lachnospiraceae bacterium]|nr:type II 3-dehydroquinate dehydratase [Lachnospiraceae bacterium]